MGTVNFITKTEGSMMDSGSITKWKDMEYSIISPIIKLIKGNGSMTNFMVKGNCTMIIQCPLTSVLTSIISIKSISLGNTIKVPL